MLHMQCKGYLHRPAVDPGSSACRPNAQRPPRHTAESLVFFEHLKPSASPEARILPQVVMHYAPHVNSLDGAEPPANQATLHNFFSAARVYRSAAGHLWQNCLPQSGWAGRVASTTRAAQMTWLQLSGSSKTALHMDCPTSNAMSIISQDSYQARTLKQQTTCLAFKIIQASKHHSN